MRTLRAIVGYGMGGDGDDSDYGDDGDECLTIKVTVVENEV